MRIAILIVACVLVYGAVQVLLPHVPWSAIAPAIAGFALWFGLWSLVLNRLQSKLDQMATQQPWLFAVLVTLMIGTMGFPLALLGTVSPSGFRLWLELVGWIVVPLFMGLFFLLRFYTAPLRARRWQQRSLGQHDQQG